MSHEIEPNSTDYAPQFPEVVDSTMMACADACTQKFFVEYVLRLTPTTKSPDLHAGGAFARGLEVFRKAFYIEESPLYHNTSACIEKSFIAFMKYWGTYNPPRDRKDQTHPKDFTNTWMALESYLVEYPPLTDMLQPYRGPDGKQKPAIEFTFALPMNVMHPVSGNPLIYGGRCDMIAQVTGGAVVINDEKTAKAMDWKLASKYNLRGQYIGYSYAAQQLGYPVQGAMTRLTVIQKTQYQHAQAWTTYPQWQIDRWWATVNARAQMLVDCFKAMQETERHINTESFTEVYTANDRHAFWPYSYGDSCTNWNGCQFSGLCEAQHPSDWYGTFARRLWNPLAQDPTEGEERALPEQTLEVDLTSGDVKGMELLK